MHAVIVDDEFMLAEYLEELIRKHCPEISSINTFTDSIEALKFLSGKTPDVLFLDIEMPGLSGFDLLESIPDSHLPPVIFTTAFNKYATQAFEVSAIHYLLKPIDPQKLKDAVGRLSNLERDKFPERLLEALSTFKKVPETISLPEGLDYHIVNVSDILRVEGSGSYSTFHLLEGKEIVVSKRLKVYADRLELQGFIRTHQSHLVNEKYIEKYSRADGGYVELGNGITVPVSPKMKSELKDRLKL